ncbi:MAG TPA: hypothetical protein VNG33_10300, partial [Polyangiaceae bacterium]|nr:hypothetical protein [Polyangiaceae bacterium]
RLGCSAAFGTTLVVVSTLAGVAQAQSSATAEAQPQTVDAARGPVTGSTRRVGLGGAFVAIADDTDGVAVNPASSGVRLPYSWSDWDYGVGVDVAVGAWLPKNDFYNQQNTQAPKKAGQSTALFGSLALLVNYRQLGLGISAEALRNSASQGDQGIGTNFAANYGLVHANLAYGFLDGQLLFGAGPRLVGLSFLGNSGSSGLLRTAGAGYEAGVIVKPTGQYRLAAAAKSSIKAKLPGAAGAPDSTVLVPWEVALGFAYQFGARPFNPRLQTAKELARQSSTGEPTRAEIKRAEDELYRDYEQSRRFYLLVGSELSVIQGGGPVGLTGEEAMDRPVISPRVGVESEVVPRHFRLRAGSYYEPARIAGTRSRVHGTGGFDVKLFRWNIFGLLAPFDYWQLSLGADAARLYLNTSLSLGFWH